LLLGNYLILELAYFRKLDGSNAWSDYFKSKHKSVKDNWENNNDSVVRSYWTDRMNYPISCAPFSIYPFDIESCADIMMGILMIRAIFNFSEIMRMLEKAGWEIVDSIKFKSDEELAAVNGKDMSVIPLLTIRKGRVVLNVPSSLIARLQYELLTPKSLIDDLEEIYRRSPNANFELGLVNYMGDKRNWQ
jgi:hypothetical protein